MSNKTHITVFSLTCMGNGTKQCKAKSSCNLNYQLPWEHWISWLGAKTLLLKGQLQKGQLWHSAFLKCQKKPKQLPRSNPHNIVMLIQKLSSVFRENKILKNSIWECASLTVFFLANHKNWKGYEVCSFRSWQNSVSKLLYTSGALAGAARPNAWDWGGPTKGQRSCVSTSSKSLQHKIGTWTSTYSTM